MGHTRGVVYSVNILIHCIVAAVNERFGGVTLNTACNLRTATRTRRTVVSIIADVWRFALLVISTSFAGSDGSWIY